MFSLRGRPSWLCDGVSRREVLRLGGLSGLGLSLPMLLGAESAEATEAAARGPGDRAFGAAKNVIYLYLQGGPPQHETFDPKPDAPAEIRGEFKPIQTNIPGVRFCELLPRTARMAHKLAVVRSMATDDNVHSSSGYWVLTGYKYRGPNARTIQPTDQPYFGSLVKMLRPSDRLPPLSTVWVPDIMRLNESVTPAGQTSGFLGGQWNPERFIGDPSDPEYKVPGLRLSDLSPDRLRGRQTLLAQLESQFDVVRRGEKAGVYDKYQQQAFDLLTTGRARAAFDLSQEPAKVRERYGPSQWGQCVLLARRLIEAGVRLVHVNWPREPGDNAVDNPLWDTHAQNADRLEDVLCPQFDVGFTALIEDLEQRGLLDETLVVAIGEFGRTPKINPKGGRDHWGPVFSFALAGAGIRGGQVYGASDKHGAYPARDRVRPGELTATLFHLLGINPRGTFNDRQGRPHHLTEGRPLSKLLGTEPATPRRVAPGGDVARVPPYDQSLLLNTDFRADIPLRSADGPSRPKGWRAGPLLTKPEDDGFGVRWTKPGPVAIGFHLGEGKTKQLRFPQGLRALLAQEVRSPFAGKYVLTVQAGGGGSSQKAFEDLFLKHFTCRLVFYQYPNGRKILSETQEVASLEFQPRFAEGPKQEFTSVQLIKEFINPKPGSNFSFGAGLGVAIRVEKTSPGVLELVEDRPPRAFLLINQVQLQFAGKERNERVKV